MLENVQNIKILYSAVADSDKRTAHKGVLRQHDVRLDGIVSDEYSVAGKIFVNDAVRIFLFESGPIRAQKEYRRNVLYRFEKKDTNSIEGAYEGDGVLVINPCSLVDKKFDQLTKNDFYDIWRKNIHKNSVSDVQMTLTIN